MNKKIVLEMLNEMGAERAYFLHPHHYFLKDNPRGLSTDARQIMPNARCLLALIFSYRPMLSPKGTAPLSAYYLASNRSYHAAKMLLNRLQEAGHAACLANLPVKTVLAEAGLASIGRNSLLALQGLGSYVAVQLLLTDAFEPVMYDELAPPCHACGNCRRACPAEAIDEKGFHLEKCLRYYMEKEPMPHWVKAKLPSLLGCELCQRACPRNKGMASLAMPEDLAERLRFKRLFMMSPEDKRFYAEQFGKNMLSGGRMRAQAISLAARRSDSGLSPAYIACLLEKGGLSLNEEDAARWYLGKF